MVTLFFSVSCMSTLFYFTYFTSLYFICSVYLFSFTFLNLSLVNAPVVLCCVNVVKDV